MRNKAKVKAVVGMAVLAHEDVIGNIEIEDIESVVEVEDFENVRRV